jgi:hypothetical protein
LGPLLPRTAATRPCGPVPIARHAAPPPTRPRGEGRGATDRLGGVLQVEGTALNQTVCGRNPSVSLYSEPSWQWTALYGWLPDLYGRSAAKTGAGIARDNPPRRGTVTDLSQRTFLPAARSQDMGALRERPAQYGPEELALNTPSDTLSAFPPKVTSKQSKALLATASPHKQDRLAQNAGALCRQEGWPRRDYGPVTAGRRRPVVRAIVSWRANTFYANSTRNESRNRGLSRRTRRWRRRRIGCSYLTGRNDQLIYVALARGSSPE